MQCDSSRNYLNVSPSYQTLDSNSAGQEIVYFYVTGMILRLSKQNIIRLWFEPVILFHISTTYFF